MFFPHLIRSIRPQDKVLEIGPGSSPHPRSNAFLELAFDSTAEKIAQRGHTQEDADFAGRPVYYYDGHRFPFADGKFDYVICSHVIEHVPAPDAFMAEVFRVGRGRGYLEYPLITYEYLYDFPVHLHFVKFDFQKRLLKFVPKNSTPFAQFFPVTQLFYKTLEMGWDDLCAANPHFFFEGFEYDRPFTVKKIGNLEEIVPAKTTMHPKGLWRRLCGRILNKLEL